MRPGSSLLIDLIICLRFYTRLPVPAASGKFPSHTLTGFSGAIRMLPFAGGLLGLLAAIVFWIASKTGFPPAIAAPLSVCALMLLSGAMHEDGLADCTDGFFGGATRERKLAIMQDSAIGSFGALALALSLYLRVAGLTIIANESLSLAGAVLIGAAAFSRTTALIPLAILPPARGNGLGFSAGKPEIAALTTAFCLAFAFALTPLLAGAGLKAIFAAIVSALCAAYGMALFAKRQIGGQTGDVAGAAQQFSEIVFYLAFAAHA
jgi:adenosylcobinamide-GDP ribazoletransferase